MREKEAAIIQRALEEGLLARCDLDDCRRTTKALASVGVVKTLLEVIEEHGHLDRETLDNLADESSPVAPPAPDLEEPDSGSFPPQPTSHSSQSSQDFFAMTASLTSPKPMEPPLEPTGSPEEPPPPPAEETRLDAPPPVEERTEADLEPPTSVVDLDRAEIEAMMEEQDERPPEATLDFQPGDLPEGLFPAETDSTATELAPNEQILRGFDLPSTNAYEKDMIGQILGGCRLEKQLGKGAMGTVFQATHLALQKTVAVKILNPSRFYQKEQVEQFFLEARAAAAIEHQNIVGAHDVGQEGGLYYIAMQFIEGETLADRIQRERCLPPKEAVRIAIEAARGLHVAHEKGIVHRDVKPANLMLTTSGEVKVADFGLALRPDEDETMTGGVEVMGTPTYMSPEQIDGRNVDRRSDLYSLGVTLYYAATGRKPFEGATPMEVLLKHMSERLVPPTQVNPAVPKPLGQVIERLLAKDPAQRYPDAEELLKDLEEVLHGGKPKAVAAMEDMMQRMEELAKAEAEPARDRRPMTAAIVSGVAAALCVILFTVALPDLGTTGTDFLRPDSGYAQEVEKSFQEAVANSKKHPSEIAEIRKTFEGIIADFPTPYPKRARAQLQVAEREFARAGREAARPHLERSAKCRREGKNLEALLALYEVPNEWLEGPLGAEIELKMATLSLIIRTQYGMTLVPGGPFLQGPDRRERYLPPFLIDVTEVSNEDYAKFVKETKHPPPAYWPGGKIRPGHEQLPVVGVSYADATAYATWAGKRLPTSTEWEKAARGTDGRTYPWGNDFHRSAANCNGFDNELSVVSSHRSGASPYGCKNMAGNAFEWTDTPDLEADGIIIRGGACRSNASNVRTFVELAISPGHTDHELPVGFRCVKEVQ